MVGGLARSRHWLCPPSLGSLPWGTSLPRVTSLAPSPHPRCFRGWQAAPWQAALLGAATGASSVPTLPMPVYPRECLWGDWPLRPCLSPGVYVICGCPGGPGSLQELLHLLSSPFCRGLLPKGSSGWGALGWGAQAGSCPCSPMQHWHCPWGQSLSRLAACRPSGFSLRFSRCQGLCQGGTTPLPLTPRRATARHPMPGDHLPSP